jgi:ribosome-binding factor A
MFLSVQLSLSLLNLVWLGLQVAKVYISIYGDDRGQEKALEALKSKAGYVRKGLAKRMNLKNTPEVRFIKDEALERGSRVRNSWFKSQIPFVQSLSCMGGYF